MPISAEPIEQSRPYKGSPWQNGKADTLQEMAFAGYSAHEISVRLGLTDKQVRSKAQSLGIHIGEIGQRKKIAVARMNKRRGSEEDSIVYKGPRPPADAYIDEPSPEDLKILETEGRDSVGLLDLTSRTCRWPIGDPLKEDFQYCGARCDMDRPYCSEHRARSLYVSKYRAKEIINAERRQSAL